MVPGRGVGARATSVVPGYVWAEALCARHAALLRRRSFPCHPAIVDSAALRGGVKP